MVRVNLNKNSKATIKRRSHTLSGCPPWDLIPEKIMHGRECEWVIVLFHSICAVKYTYDACQFKSHSKEYMIRKTTHPTAINESC